VKKLLIIAGESSGDLYGAYLAESLFKRSFDVELFGVGGPLMRRAGVRILHDIIEHAAVGIVEVSSSLHKLIRVFNQTVDCVKREKPDAVILIDYPEFNLRFARRAHKLGVPVIYYVSPQVWAWRKGRVKQIQRHVQEMLVIFPFEKEFYDQHNIPAKFVGHPLLDILKNVPSREQARADLGLSQEPPVIGLLPGSRSKEFDRLFPIFLEAAKLIKNEIKDVRFVLGCGSAFTPEMVRPYLRNCDTEVLEVYNDTYHVMRASDLLLVASGTATVEAAILNTPMIVSYKVSWLTSALVARLMKLKSYAMVNIVAGRQIVPEFLQGNAKPENIARSALDMFRNGGLDAVREYLKRTVAQLGPSGATDRAANEIISVVSKGN